jgi:hypothetical protein
MNKIVEFLQRFMLLDKWMHAGIGAAIVIVTYAAVVLPGLAEQLLAKIGVLLVGFLLARTAAFFKEGYDEAHPERHTKDVLDAEMTVSGAAFTTAVMLCYLLVTHAP